MSPLKSKSAVAAFCRRAMPDWNAASERLREISARAWLRGGAALAGFLALVWFLVRVVPKPSRAAYPCQRAAFPLASAFVLWVCGFFGFAATLRRARFALARSRYRAAAGFLALAALSLALTQSVDSTRARADYAPADPANTPIGVARGIFPGRVVWVHDPAATTWDVSLDDDAVLRYWDDAHTDQAAVDAMMAQALRRLAGAGTDAAAWDAFFRHFNRERGRGDRGYQAGEKIAVKLNHVEQRSHRGNSNNTGDNRNYADLSPQVTVALLKQLVNQAGVPDTAITIGDPSRFVADKTYNRCYALFPGVTFIEDNFSYPSNPVGTEGRTKSLPTAAAVMKYSGLNKDGQPLPAHSLPQAMYEADYIINLGIMKGHPQSAVTFSGKNWYGCLTQRPTDAHHNLAWMLGSAPSPTPQAGQYRAMVDLMGHEHLGGKTMLYLLDGLWGFQTHGTSSRPRKWQNVPFGGDYPSSLLASQDPVAIDSVGLDFIRSEFADNMGGSDIEGTIDDYMHEAALAHDPPSGVFYDPEQDGTRLASLGAHEHWNDPVEKLYSRNLNTGEGIELVAISAAQPRATGAARVEVSPAAASWSLRGPEGLALDDSGATTVLSAPTGRYEITWNPLPGYFDPNPATEERFLTEGAEIVFQASYEQILPPTVALLSPVEGAVFVPGSKILLTADAQSTQSAVAEVEFFVNGASLGTDSSAPWELEWPAPPQGEHQILVRATDANGIAADSAPVHVTLGMPLRDCLLVVGPATLAAGDIAISERLAQWGYYVIPITATASQPSDAAGKALVFISESVSSNNVSTKFRDTAVPVLCCEDYNYDEMMMTGLAVGVDYGYLDGQADVVITAENSPLAAGLPPGATAVYSSAGRLLWGIPNANATRAAHIAGDPAKIASFGYEQGAEMFGGFIAPARRTGFFLSSYTQEMTLLTPAGLALFDAAVRWTGASTSAPAPGSPAPLQGALAGDYAVLTWENPGATEEGFELESSPDGVTFTLLSRFAADVTEVSDEIETPGAPVYYRVRAWNGEGYSAWSNILRLPPEPSAISQWIAF